MFSVPRRGLVAILMVGAPAVFMVSQESSGQLLTSEEYERQSLVLEQLK